MSPAKFPAAEPALALRWPADGSLAGKDEFASASVVVVSTESEVCFFWLAIVLVSETLTTGSFTFGD